MDIIRFFSREYHLLLNATDNDESPLGTGFT